MSDNNNVIPMRTGPAAVLAYLRIRQAAEHYREQIRELKAAEQRGAQLELPLFDEDDSAPARRGRIGER